jgi:D-xylose 1-dehydrogenase (NADP+, D-xylono-1,5-lactone-forming)
VTEGTVDIEPVRFGVLSTARINRHVLRGAAESDRVHIRAVASRDQNRADAYAREHGIDRAYGSYDALLADPELDAVYISLPNSLHVEWSVRALEAGKHVLCEKPLGWREADVQRAFDAADRAGRLLAEAFMWRHNPQTAKLQELVRSGVIGELRHVRAAFSFTLTDEGNIRLRADVEGGALMDVGCYCVSGVRLLAGEPDDVFGLQLTGPTGVDMRFSGVLRFPNDVTAQFHCGFDLPSESRLEPIGSRGSIVVRDPWHARKPGLEVRREDGSEWIDAELANSYRLELENLAAAILGAGEPLLGREDALAQARVIEALYLSAATGTVVSL